MRQPRYGFVHSPLLGAILNVEGAIRVNSFFIDSGRTRKPLQRLSGRTEANRQTECVMVSVWRRNNEHRGAVLVSWIS